ncbi:MULTISPECIES: ABC transporter substrate-binding protein [Paenibacillus]|uniref:Peptide-binding protein n=1 Tax=Paenibacillus albilobatus TaxID=2716884 RepID=A0A920C832_9BACL|nr:MULTISPECIES: ABC transporter substrate-binding protein [Paenibacillus]GIO29651.1 peptide-binding protein [Paenibacillus albilobatus]
MLIKEQYLMLHSRFSNGKESGVPIEVTLEDLSEALYCTVRNAKLILRKLVDEGWVDWLPGRGRGNYSRITFQEEKEDFLLNLAIELAQDGDYRHAFEKIGSYSSGTQAKERFLDWLNGHFGYKKEEGAEGSPATDNLIFPVLYPPRTLDPATASFAFDSHLQRQIFDRLLTYDERLCRIVPGVAHHWSHNEAATEWTFYLRKGIRFHHGQEMTSADVLFSLNRLRRNTENEWLLRGVERIDALGPRVVRIRLRKPNRIFDRFMCSVGVSILPADFAGQEEENFWNLPLGSGPFRVVSFSKHRVELAAHSHYYQGRPYLDGVDIVIMPADCNPESVGFTSVLHMMDRYRQEDRGGAVPDLRQGCTMLCWNVKREGPQQSEAFRRAAKMILHPGEMIAELGGPRILPAFGFRPCESRGRVIDPIRPERVKAALKESCYEGRPVRLAVYDKYKDDAAWIRKRLSEWGIRVEIENHKNWKEADCTLSSIVLAEDEVCEIETYENGINGLRLYLDEERMNWIKSRIDDALEAESGEARRMTFREIEEYLRDEASVIFLHHRQLDAFLHPFVRGMSLNPLGWVDFKDIWLEKHD